MGDVIGEVGEALKPSTRSRDEEGRIKSTIDDTGSDNTIQGPSG